MKARYKVDKKRADMCSTGRSREFVKRVESYGSREGGSGSTPVLPPPDPDEEEAEDDGSIGA